MKILSNVQARAVQMLLQTEAPYFIAAWDDPRGRVEVRGVYPTVVVLRGEDGLERYETAKHFMNTYAFLL